MLNAGAPLTRKAEVKSLMSLLAALAEGFKVAAEVMEATHATLDESERYRDAIKRQSKPLDYESLLTLIEQADTKFTPRISDVLRRAMVVKFELGRLWINPENRADEITIGFQKERLMRVLKDNFGVDFNIRYRHNKE